MAARITKRIVDAAKLGVRPADGKHCESFIWDAELKGFGSR
jgi:hypothetical protein